MASARNTLAGASAAPAVLSLLLCLLFAPAKSSAGDPHGAFNGLLQSVSQARSGSVDDKGATTARGFYISDVEPVVQEKCVVCHQQGLTADQQGARLLFTDDAGANHDALEAFVTSDGVGAEWLLNKVVGGLNHGGGPVLTAGSADYLAFSDYLTLLIGANTDDGTANASDLWSGTVSEGREATLRRAAILLAGKVPSQAAINRATVSDAALKDELIKLMKGDDFHDFIVTGAGDRLLTDGLMNGIDFQFDFNWRFPAFASFQVGLPEDVPEELQTEEYWDKPFLQQNQASNEFRVAVIQEPLELIAHIVQRNLSYKKVLTADYTMVNAFSAIGYQSDITFDAPLMDENGFYDRSQLTDFRPARNTGHIPFTDDTYYDEDTGAYEVSEYHDWPHAGILSMPAWLGRYPSTDTNRNRARARWTYYHFLDVDIEKSAPRTTDPVALADTNNPTMNNPACTVCHERMDPVAGAYQKFGNVGHYLDQHGGLDSLPDSYKHPEWSGGEPGSTGYVEGDTWYRDMRAPGFEGEVHTGSQDSLQWLAQKIADDPRFPRATVKFWWPAVFGAEALAAPADRGLPDYDAQLMAFNAQEAVIDELAAAFETGGFKLKSLLADMVLSPWYRTAGVDEALDETQAAALATVGRGRLLTPEELDRKNKAVFGRTWGENENYGNSAHDYRPVTNFSRPWQGYATFYGGIDGATVTDRNRELTPLMSNVVEKMAVDLACQVVLSEFNKPRAERSVFNLLDRETDPMGLAKADFRLQRDAGLAQSDWQYYDRSQDFSTGDGKVVFKFQDSSPRACVRDEENSTEDRWEGWCSHMGVKQIEVHKGGLRVLSMSADEFEGSEAFIPPTWTDNETGEVRVAGWWSGQGDGSTVFFASSYEDFAFQFDLGPGDYTLTAELVSFLNDGHPEDATSVSLTVRSQVLDPSSEGAVALSRQLDKLYLQATGDALPEESNDRLMDAFVAYSETAAGRGDWYDGHCDTWQIWDNSDSRTHEEWRVLMGDPIGTMQGWTLIIHSLMTSYSYLHD